MPQDVVVHKDKFEPFATKDPAVAEVENSQIEETSSRNREIDHVYPTRNSVSDAVKDTSISRPG
jgi:hypothetical protein